MLDLNKVFIDCVKIRNKNWAKASWVQWDKNESYLRNKDFGLRISAINVVETPHQYEEYVEPEVEPNDCPVCFNDACFANQGVHHEWNVICDACSTRGPDMSSREDDISCWNRLSYSRE